MKSKKLTPPFSIKTNGLKDAKETIDLLIQKGFTPNEKWNREQLAKSYYDNHLDKGFVNVNALNIIELHTHDCLVKPLNRKHLLKEIPKPDYDPKEVAFNEFVFPEKWYIEIDSENVEALNKYLHDNKEKYLGYHKDWKVTLAEDGFEESIDYFYSESKEPSHSSFLKREGFTKITFDQFREHVLLEDIKHKNKEVFETRYGNKYFLDTHNPKKFVGYKLVKEEYKEAVNMILGFKEDDNWVLENDIHASLLEEIEKAGVLHWFEKVLTIEEKISDYLASEGIGITDEQAKEIINIVNGK